jgi:hypothetical protein
MAKQKQSANILIEGLIDSLLRTMQSTNLPLSVLSLVAYTVYRKIDDEKNRVIQGEVMEAQAQARIAVVKLKEKEKK